MDRLVALHRNGKTIRGIRIRVAMLMDEWTTKCASEPRQFLPKAGQILLDGLLKTTMQSTASSSWGNFGFEERVWSRICFGLAKDANSDSTHREETALGSYQSPRNQSAMRPMVFTSST